MQNALEYCVDFILNQCTGKELDVIIATVERRKKSLSGEFSFNLEESSKKISDEINASIQKSMDGVTKSLRDFSEGLIANESPDLTPEQVSALAAKWIPDISFDGSVKSLAKDGKVDGIPVDLMYNMVLQFVDYGIGKMSQEKNTELKSSLGSWQEKYWKRFPTKMRETIKTFFDGKTTFGEFNKTIKQLLGLA
ncbi:MAG: hypothetical protein P1P64_08350 [Treponemataceae bacterium]